MSAAKTNSVYATTVDGGHENTKNANYTTISGGNMGSGFHAAIGGGYANTNSGYSAVIGGDSNNMASGDYATIPGGRNNAATSDVFASGRRAKADETGAFVWADSTDADVASNFSNQFLICEGGRAGITTNNPGTDAPSLEGLVRFNGPVNIKVNRTIIRVQSDGRVFIQAVGNLDLQAGCNISISGVNVTVDSASQATGLGGRTAMITVLGVPCRRLPYWRGQKLLPSRSANTKRRGTIGCESGHGLQPTTTAI